MDRRNFFKTLLAGLAWIPGLGFLKYKPSGQSIPFGTLPSTVYIRGPRYRVMYDKTICSNVRYCPNATK